MVVMSSTEPRHIHKRGGELGTKLSGRGDCNMYTTTNVVGAYMQGAVEVDSDTMGSV